ncbi:hypothetical protein CFP56_036117, partial [Quercus suber]
YGVGLISRKPFVDKWCRCTATWACILVQSSEELTCLIRVLHTTLKAYIRWSAKIANAVTRMAVSDESKLKFLELKEKTQIKSKDLSSIYLPMSPAMLSMIFFSSLMIDENYQKSKSFSLHEHFCSSAEQKSRQILLPKFNAERCSPLLACDYIEGQNNKQFMQLCLRKFTSRVFQVTWYIKVEKYDGLCFSFKDRCKRKWMAFKSSCKQQNLAKELHHWKVEEARKFEEAKKNHIMVLV